MFLLVHKNRVIVGPMSWHYGMFSHGLERIESTAFIPRSEPQTLPLILDENTKIVKCREIIPSYNKKIQYIHGPFWNFDEPIAIGTYEIKDTPIELVKNTLIEELAAERYKKEIAGCKVNIQSTEVTVDTNRGSRDIFIQKYLLMGDNDTVQWKFPEGWLTLSKTDLGAIVSAGVTHVQTAFNWEKTKLDLINNSTSSLELDSISLTE